MAAFIVNVIAFWPEGCAAPLSVQYEKVYPAGSNAGA
jgi:hypothetical protein